MRIVRTAAVALLSGCLMSGATALVWPAPPVSDALTVAQAASYNLVVQAGSDILVVLESPRVRIRPNAPNSCKPGKIYSAHDIVGDPQACIMGSFGDIGGARSTMARVPAL